MESKGEIVIYTNSDGNTEIEVRLEEESIWLTQSQIVDLFKSSKANISEHIANIYDTGELTRESTVRKFRTVRLEGKREVTRNLEYYNLDMIISIGYRVNSKRGTQFRIWANKILKDHLIKGYSLNENRLKDREQELQLLKSSIKVLERSIHRQTKTGTYTPCNKYQSVAIHIIWSKSKHENFQHILQILFTHPVPAFNRLRS